MFVDSHCHLDRIDLAPYNNDFDQFMLAVNEHHIDQMLCISIDMENYPSMVNLVEKYPQIHLSTGVHPNTQNGKEPSAEELVKFGQNSKVIAIGETGLDYFRSDGDLNWQHERFRQHIKAAKMLKKPLIIHTRDAGEDTLEILQEQGAEKVGGIIHCFTENWDFALKAMELNFYISFSGIVTFNNAKEIQKVAQKIPSDRFLIETDSPYLAPVPFRGRPNYPIYVSHVAQKIAELRNEKIEIIAQQSTHNFNRLFNL